MGTCPSTLPVIKIECGEPIHHTEVGYYQILASADLNSGNSTIKDLEASIEKFIIDEHYERCAGIKRAIELHKKFG
jgi:hypothetical protein